MLHVYIDDITTSATLSDTVLTLYSASDNSAHDTDIIMLHLTTLFTVLVILFGIRQLGSCFMQKTER
jgi:hypothetical protein